MRKCNDFDAVLVADAARFGLVDYDPADDRMTHLTPSHMTFLKSHWYHSLWTRTPLVRKLVCQDITVYFVWGPASSLVSLIGKISASKKHREGLHLWIVGAKDASVDEQNAQYHKLWR